MDYRDIPEQTFDKIVSLEMVEHVGVKNLTTFYELVRDLLADDGLFLLQWTGLRRGLRPEDLIWGLFMNKYIFPGADASLCPSRMLKAMEKAGFEMHSVENISIHYAWTIQRWHDNWLEQPGRDRRRLRRALVPHLALLPRLVGAHRASRATPPASRSCSTRTSIGSLGSGGSSTAARCSAIARKPSHLPVRGQSRSRSRPACTRRSEHRVERRARYASLTGPLDAHGTLRENVEAQ